MKKTVSICSILLLMLFIGACSSPTKTAELTSADIFTQVAITLTAQAGSAAPSATAALLPSSTITATGLSISLPTLDVKPTQIARAPTQTVVNVAPPSTGSTCNNSLYVSDVTIPDGTVVAPGQAFVKTWKFQNSGTCAWTSDYQIIFASGKAMSGTTTAIAKAVSAGNNVNVSVSMIAPTAVGTYTGNWRLADPSGTSFGAYVYVQIKVSKDAATLTVTPTLTATGDTSTPTDTPAADEATATRTRTPTATPKPSKTVAPTDTSTSGPEASKTLSP
jgi:hypothetical protein